MFSHSKMKNFSDLELKTLRASLTVSKIFIYSISIFTLSVTLYLFLLQQYSLFHSLLYINILFYYFTTFKYYIFYFPNCCFAQKKTNCCRGDRNQKPPEIWTTKNHRGDLNNQQPKTTVVAPLDRWDRRGVVEPPWRSEQPTTKNHRGGASRRLGSSRRGGPCFTAWWSLLHGVASVVTDLSREPRRGSLLGGGWWFQVVAGCWEKKKKRFWRVEFIGKIFCWWFRNVLAYLLQPKTKRAIERRERTEWRERKNQLEMSSKKKLKNL